MIVKTDVRIHELREQSGLTQKELAVRLGVTRACVNSWEMGISVPTTTKIVELAQFFKTSTDYILGIEPKKMIYLDSLTEDQSGLVMHMIQYFNKIEENNVNYPGL